MGKAGVYEGARLEGLNTVIANLNKQIKKAGINSAIGLERCVKLIERESKKQVPVDIGNLRASWFAEVRPVFPAGYYAEMGYSAVYAVRQHEELGYSHTQGKAKYLEDPLKETSPLLLEILADQIRKGTQ